MEAAVISVHEALPPPPIVKRPLANFQPSIWGDYFITHHSDPPHPHQMTEAQIKKRVEEMVEEVKGMLNKEIDLLRKMQMIDALQRLGVSYHFEEDITMALRRIHDNEELGNVVDDGDNLDKVSLWFRLLRQNGYNVSSDVFNKFKGGDGKFKSILSSDSKGLLSLYEAAHLGVPGEAILDEAIDFSRTLLGRVVEHLEAPLAALVSQSIETPLVRKMKILEARNYISIYQDYKEIRNDTVLELAKLNYHLLQLLYWEEVRKVCLWMKESGIMEKLPFARDRAVESYFWALGVYFEPFHSRSRIIIAKVIFIMSIIDDIYDSYGTLDELALYTEAVQRWDVEVVDLPIYMKEQLLAMINTFKGLENELAAEGRSCRVYYLKEAMKSLVIAYYEEAKWRQENYVPTVEEHQTVSLVTGGHPLLPLASYMDLGDEVATKEVFEWILRFPRIAEASCRVARFMDDIAGHEFEQSREHVASLVECYMNQHDVSLKEAYEKLREVVENEWRIMNKACLSPTEVSIPLLTPLVNLARVIQTIYANNDGFTHPTIFLKDKIDLVLVQPVPM